MDIDTSPSNSNGKLGKEFAMSFINPKVSQPEIQTAKQNKSNKPKGYRPVKVTGKDKKEDTQQERKSYNFRRPKLSRLFSGITKGRVVSKKLLKKTKIVVRIPEYKNESYKSIYFSQAFAEGKEGNNSLKSDKGMFWS